MKLQTHPINHTHTHTRPLSPGQSGIGWSERATELPLFALFLFWQMRKQRQTTQKALRSLCVSLYECVCVSVYVYCVCATECLHIL